MRDDGRDLEWALARFVLVIALAVVAWVAVFCP